MKNYLIVTGMLFGALTLVHLVMTVEEWRRLATDPGFILEGPTPGVVAGALCFWAWRLLRVSARS